MYDPVYVSKRDGITVEEAVIKVENFKKNKATSLSGFIHRFGDELGRLKFQKFQSTSRHTEEIYISRYGEEVGKKKWKEYLLKKDSTSFSWALKKCGGDIEKAKILSADRIEKLRVKFDLDYFINKYGAEAASMEMDKFYSTKDTSSYQWALKKANFDFKLADKIYQERCDSKSVGLGKASKESIIVLKPVFDWLIENGFESKDIFWGVEGSNEILLYDSTCKKRYYYDFCIESLKLIIEYNGETFHPNYEKHSIEYLKENFTHPYKKDMTAEAMIQKDKDKIAHALRFGYDIHIIWSSEENKTEKILQIIKNKIHEYENKIN